METFQFKQMKKSREDQGLTQDECGRTSGLGQSRWADFEGGKYPNMTLASLIAIARALDLESYDELLPPIRLDAAAKPPRKPASKPRSKKGGA